MTTTKKTTRLLSILLAILMMVGVFSSLPQLSANTTPLNSDTVAISVTKVINNNTAVNDETFTFNIAANNLTLAAPLPNVTTATVTGAGTTVFAPITYTSAGRYYYDITEVAGTNPDYTYDSDTYIVCVEVTNGVDNVLSASIVAIWKNNVVNETSAKLEKVQFTNTYNVEPTPEPGSLTLSKTVTGELADMNMGFTFNVVFSDNTYSFNAGAMGTITNGTGTITLKNGESVTFTDLPADCTYTIIETNGDAYTTTVNNNGTTVNGKEVTGGINTLAEAIVAYTNDLPYTPMVGVTMNQLPFILLGLFGLALLGFMFIRRRKMSAEN